VLSAQGDKLIRAAEGYRTSAYRDTLGNWTVGYGHELPATQDWTNVAWPPGQLEAWYQQDKQDALQLAYSLPEYYVVAQVQCREDALIELCFNMGYKWLNFIQARDAMMKQDWPEAGRQILNSAADHEEPKRIARLAAMISTGVYPT
jgi:GH24 family phage-related lysozyme (muramidase)